MCLQSDLARPAVGIATLDMMFRYLPVERAQSPVVELRM